MLYITIDRNTLTPWLEVMESMGLGNESFAMELKSGKSGGAAQEQEFITFGVSELHQSLKALIIKIVGKGESLYTPSLFLGVEELVELLTRWVDEEQAFFNFAQQQHRESVLYRNHFSRVVSKASRIGEDLLLIFALYLLLYISIFWLYYELYIQGGVEKRILSRLQMPLMTMSIILGTMFVPLILIARNMYDFTPDYTRKQKELAQKMSREISQKISEGFKADELEALINSLHTAVKKIKEEHCCVICIENYEEISKYNEGKVWRIMPFQSPDSKHSVLCDGAITCYECYPHQYPIGTCPVCRHPIDKERASREALYSSAISPDASYHKMVERIENLDKKTRAFNVKTDVQAIVDKLNRLEKRLNAIL